MLVPVMIISITGSTSNVGKTTLIEKMLQSLSGTWGVCKVTICSPGRRHRCPHGKDETCGICNENLSTFVAETNKSVLRQTGKDTWRYYEAGAERVVWVRSREEALGEGINAALDQMQDLTGIIFEGNHALTVLEPDIAVMVLSTPLRYKASAKNIRKKIGISGEASDPELLQRILRTVQEKEAPRQREL